MSRHAYTDATKALLFPPFNTFKSVPENDSPD
jgi:hypothetical protein